MPGNLVILHTVFITTEQFGHIETQITKKKTLYISLEFFKRHFFKALKLYFRRKSEFRRVGKGPLYMGEKILSASTIFYLWIIMFKIADFEHPSEGKKAEALSEDARESSYAIYILYMKPKMWVGL